MWQPSFRLSGSAVEVALARTALICCSAPANHGSMGHYLPKPLLTTLLNCGVIVAVLPITWAT